MWRLTEKHPERGAHLYGRWNGGLGCRPE